MATRAELFTDLGDDTTRALADRISGRKPLTFLDHGKRAAFPGDTLARLREIKRRRDPHGVFLGNFPVLR